VVTSSSGAPTSWNDAVEGDGGVSVGSGGSADV
jgi:hypothetical protein